MKKRNVRRNQCGMTIIELLIAMVVLAAGLAGTMALVSGAITSNSRNRFDTTASTLSEMVLDTIAAAGPSATGQIAINDCANPSNTLNLSTAPGGATVDSNGNISFAGTAPSGYGITYVGCAKGNTQVTYDIRWNIVTHVSGTTTFTKTITVSARESSAGGLPTLFAPPATLRTTISN